MELNFKEWLIEAGLIGNIHHKFSVLPQIKKEDPGITDWFSEKIDQALKMVKDTFIHNLVKTPESQIPDTNQMGDLDNPRWANLRQWVSQNGGNMQQMRFLGKGQNGRAYKVGNIVMKVTGDVAEAKVASMVKSHNLPVTVIDIKKVTGWQPDTYVILSTFANQNRVSKDLKDAGIVIRTYLERDVIAGGKEAQDKFAKGDSIKNSVDAIRNYSWFKQVRTMPYAWKPYSLTKLKYLIPYMRVILDVVHKVMGVSGMIWHDMHPDNLGNNDKGQLMLFDLGVSYTYDKRQPPPIEEI